MQNEIRDNLIELLTGFEGNFMQYMCEECDKAIKGDFAEHIFTRIEFYADKLIENGVIVPPCKVGDTVYVITIKRPCYACILCTDYCHRNCSFDDKNKLVVKTARVVAIEYETKGKFCVEIDRSKICNSYNYTYWFEDFGKTVFPTKEEAEKALKEGINNG